MLVEQTNASGGTTAAVPLVGRIGRLGRWLGPLLAVALWSIPPTWAGELPPPAQTTAAITALVATWWVTEAYPLAAVSLLPLVLFPLCGVLPIDKAAAAYGHKYVFLFLAGFMISRALERWNLHRRIALLTVLLVGTRPTRLVGGIMLATGLTSMWISNTATAAMMLPLGLSLVSLIVEHVRAGDSGSVDTENFATCMMLGIAYSASLGGLGTLIGTPTNLLLAGFAKRNGLDITFAAWLWFAAPLAVLYILVAWGVLTRWVFPIRLREIPGGRELMQRELAALGPVARGEWTVLVVFTCTAAGWILREPLASSESLVALLPIVQNLDDSLIGLAGAIALFLIPVDREQRQMALDWQTASQIPWAILLLFGGGFCVADAIADSRLSDWIGSHVAMLQGMPILVLLVASVALMIVMTELTSNTPTAAAFLPVLYGVSQGIGINALWLLVPATIAASCAFMLPIGTPPNAIAFGSGYISMPQMIRAGWLLNGAGIALIPLWMYAFGPWVFGISR